MRAPVNSDVYKRQTINKAGKQKLIIQDLRDYAVILVDGKQVASLDRRYNQNNVMLVTSFKFIVVRLQLDWLVIMIKLFSIIQHPEYIIVFK